jgi:hypothetical protein
VIPGVFQEDHRSHQHMWWDEMLLGSAGVNHLTGAFSLNGRYQQCQSHVRKKSLTQYHGGSLSYLTTGTQLQVDLLPYEITEKEFEGKIRLPVLYTLPTTRARGQDLAGDLDSVFIGGVQYICTYVKNIKHQGMYA